MFCAAAAASAAGADNEFFEQRIRPILVNECYECHGAEKQKGGLRLDSREALLKGGDSGPALIPGQSDESLLLRTITHVDGVPAMPHKRPKLSAGVVEDFRDWIRNGAPDPRDSPQPATVLTSAWRTVFEARKDWWSFKPLNVTHPPQPKMAWSDHPVDRFLLKKMEEHSLSPAAPAERHTLIRRLTFVLTGLPPTVDEVNAFLADTNPDAFSKVVERLLSSPRFGEHWARHWMDLVRYAETHGSEGDPEIPNAWRYRDYLIRAMNQDVSWGQLIREHVAGDLLENPRLNLAEGINESVIGLAHYRLVEHGFNPIDTLEEQVKTIDSQIDVISKAFQGLTTSCARCHDHKFDPISQRDYYALYGVLASVRPTQLTIDTAERLQKNRVELEAIKGKIKSALAEQWKSDAGKIEEVLLQEAGGGVAERPGSDLHKEILAAEKRLRELGKAAEARVLEKAGKNRLPAEPMAVWTFDADASDSRGGLQGQLEGGATIRGGRLILNGERSFLKTHPLKETLHEKTLEAWVALSSLEQMGGGVLTVESEDGAVFDSIVFAEKEARKWTVGSDFYRRSKNLEGSPESAGQNEFIHVVIVYGKDNSVTFYRNGERYGETYKTHNAPLPRFEAGRSRVLLGMRHTGGGNAFLKGEIEEARIYKRELSAEEVRASHKSGPGAALVTEAEIAAALTAVELEEKKSLEKKLIGFRERLARKFPMFIPEQEARERLRSKMAAAANIEGHPLQLWKAVIGSDHPLRDAWRKAVEAHVQRRGEAKVFNDKTFVNGWDFATSAPVEWFSYYCAQQAKVPGEFAVAPEGNQAITGLLGLGVYTHFLSEKHNGVFASPSFRITNNFISVLATGGKGARVRVIPDNYPIGQGNIYPQANLTSDQPAWVQLDVEYRKGTMAYIEFATAEEVTSRERARPGPGGRSFFGVQQIVFHDEKSRPLNLHQPAEVLVHDTTPPSSRMELAMRFGDALRLAIGAWTSGRINESERLLLDSFVRSGLLSAELHGNSQLANLVTEYRRLEAEIPEPRRAPGVFEAEPADAPLLVRGNHKQPLDPIPRGYLELVTASPFGREHSGRLDLAERLVDPRNPLTSRVMVNRIWYYLFGRGLVATLDNFGRLGEQPAHPELLDYLADRFVQNGWSAKEMIRFLVSSKAWQLSHETAEKFRQLDADNQYYSRADVRRLPAEAIRDSLLVLGGQMDATMYGPGENPLAAAPEQKRRSVYMTIRRNFLSPFLAIFDAPRPFSTLGKRDATNVPGQSLALLNDPFVKEQAARWSASLTSPVEPERRVRQMFEQALSRGPSSEELAASLEYVAALREAHESDEMAVWRDFGQSIFNLKEFIYIQ